MAKEKSNNKPPTVEELIADLKEKGGKHIPWYEVRGATFGPVRNAALATGKVEITNDGGLRLVAKKASKEGK